MTDPIEEIAERYDGTEKVPTEVSMAVIDRDTVAYLNDRREPVSFFRRVEE